MASFLVFQVGHYTDGETYKPIYESVDGQQSYAKYLMEAHVLDNARSLPDR